MKKLFIILSLIVALIIGVAQFALASSATQIEMFLNGVTDPNTFAPASAGVVYVYSAGTTTNKTTWTDRAKTTPTQNPFTLNSMGQAQVYGEGIYKFVIKDSVGGATLYTYDNISIGTIQGPWVDISQYASLTAAVTAIGPTNKTTLLISGDTTITANTIVTDNISLLLQSAGRILKTSTYTLTINGPFQSGPYQSLSGFGTADVSFGTKTTPEVRASWFGGLNAAVASLGTTTTTLLVEAPETLTASLLIPASINLNFANGGSIVSASTYTVTINGYLDAAPNKIFTDFSAGEVNFGVGAVKEVYPEWWGVDGTNDEEEINFAVKS